MQLVEEQLKIPVNFRNRKTLERLVPLIKHIPFFKERGLKDSAILDTLSLFTFKEMKKDEFVIDYGSFSSEFYVILQGECEVLVPD